MSGGSVLGRILVALIVDNLRISHWQAEALLQLSDSADFVVLNCTNTRFSRRPFRHALYYLLNVLALKNRETRSVPLPAELNIVERLDFASEWDGAWQRLPGQVLDQLGKWHPDVAVKFGMGLLKVPEALECKILSYHHGDPRRFRGRPAGFYELLGDVPSVGQIVQIISSRLDSGAVVAFAETRARGHSYRATMAEAFRLSPLLMKSAVHNCLSGQVLAIEATGRNYRLPSNRTVARFAAKLVDAKLRRIVNALFWEKAWKVGWMALEPDTLPQLLDSLSDAAQWQVVSEPSTYAFLADPFPHPRDGILVEALRRRDGQGEIVHIADASARLMCEGAGHFSYPGTICVEGRCFLVPEVAEWSEPRIYRITDNGCEFVRELDIGGSPRLVDPTLHEADGVLYLFGNALAEGTEVLRLWTSTDLFGRFSEHPASPIRISPEGGRMAGAILHIGGRRFRFGQDCTRGYGDGIVVFEICRLSPTDYEEVELRSLAFSGVKGPHTLNLGNGIACFDF